MFRDLKIKEWDHTDALIAQALGKDVSVKNQDGELEAYFYNGSVYILSIQESRNERER